jgi:MFS transporter, DHA2 family, methylenomycin A resistance protein
MMPLELFRARSVSIAVTVGLAFIVAYYGLPFVMSLYSQQQRRLSSAGAGVAFLPMMLVGLALTPFSACIAERARARLLVCGGLAVMNVGLVALAAVRRRSRCGCWRR